jgi:hypothetical protein
MSLRKQDVKVGTKVKFVSESGPIEHGTITHVLGKRFEVTWNDGESYSYTDPVSIFLDT